MRRRMCLAVLALALSLTACKAQTPAPETVVPETTAAAQTVVTTETTAPEETAPEIPDAYQQLLTAYAEALAQHLDMEGYFERELNYLVGVVNDSNQIGYCLTDLDGDGRDELLIGAVGDPDIYAMYTLTDGIARMVIDAGERNNFRMDTQGRIFNQASCSAAQSGVFLFTFTGGQLVIQESLVADYAVDMENPWFRVSDQNFDPATYVPVSNQEAEEILSRLEDNVRVFAYIPFSQFQG